MSALREFAETIAQNNWPSQVMHKPKVWGHGEHADLTRISEDEARPSSYRLRFRHRVYEEPARALGWIYDPARRSFEPPSIQHVAMLVSQAGEGLAESLKSDLAAHNPVMDRIPAPCLHYLPSHSRFVVAAGEKYASWLRTIGFEHSQTSKLWFTRSALAAAPLSSIATPQALEMLKAALPGYKIISDFKKTEPIARPWMGYDPHTQQFQVNANHAIAQRFFQIAPQELELSQSKTQVFLKSPDVARQLLAIAEPRLKEALDDKRFLDMDPLGLLDLFGEIVQGQAATTKRKKQLAMAEAKAMTFRRDKATYATSRVEASHDPRWAPGRGGFYFTKDADAAIALRSHADEDAEIAIQKAMVASIDHEAERRKPGLIVPASPNPALSYRDVQLEGVAFSASRRFSINADPMGFGKTVQAVGVSEGINADSVLVITLASVAPAFAQAFENWTNRAGEVQLFLNPDKTPARKGVIVASYEAATTHYEALTAVAPDLLVVDEVHKAKNDSAKRTDVLQRHIAPRAGTIMAMSGTPVPRRPQDLFTVLNMGAPDIFPSKTRFNELYGVGSLSSDDAARQARRRLLGETLYSGLMIRRPKGLLGLPPKIRNTITLNQIDRELAEQLEREGLALRAMGRATTVVERSRIMVALQQMRMHSALKKVPAAIDWALTQRRMGHRFVLFAHHHAVLGELEKLGRHLGLDLVVVHGNSGNPRQRQKLISEFQEGAGDGILAGIMAAGTGTTITAASRALMVELDWNPFEMLQAEDRLHRIGQLLDVGIDYMVFARSVDARIATIAHHKLMMADDILGLDGETIDEALVADFKIAA